MTKDQAAAVLADIPEVKSVEVARLHPGDVIVLSYDGNLSQDTAKRLESFMKEIWPGNKVVVLDQNMTMKVVRDGRDCPPGPNGEKGDPGRNYQ